MRTVYKWTSGRLLDRDGFPVLNQAQEAAEPCMPMVMRDIADYRNMIDGKVIGSRSQHREFLKRHNVIEVGNERLGPKSVLPKGEIRREIKESIEQIEQGYVDPDFGQLDAQPEASELPDIDVSSDIKDGDYIRSDVPADK